MNYLFFQKKNAMIALTAISAMRNTTSRSLRTLQITIQRSKYHPIKTPIYQITLSEKALKIILYKIQHYFIFITGYLRDSLYHIYLLTLRI